MEHTRRAFFWWKYYIDPKGEMWRYLSERKTCITLTQHFFPLIYSPRFRTVWTKLSIETLQVIAKDQRSEHKDLRCGPPT